MRATGPAPTRLLIGSFLAIITTGTFLLLLPISTPSERPIGVIDALFTATSATCVTGLVVRDTGAEFTPFGQVVILCLIQLGGLGVMTFSLLFYSLIMGRLSLASRSILTQTLAGAGGWSDFWPLLRLVFKFTFGVELLGALLLFAVWYPALGAGQAAWSGIFHAVSAFCNAGFSLWPTSLMEYRDDVPVNAVMAGLIVLGGLGFLTVHELNAWRKARVRSLHTKLVLSVSALLVAGGTAVVWLLESGRSLAGLGPARQLLASLFQSVTARTAGFNTVDIAALAPATLFFLILLMFVGGSPGSCAGGIKTTTLGVLALATWHRLRSRTRVNAFRRTLPRSTVENTLAVTFGGLAVTTLGLFFLLILESFGSGELARGAFLDYLFETVSAFGTVGLSTGITATLGPDSRLLLALLMFVGRLGPLTVAAAVARENPPDDWQYAEEGLMVG